MNVNRTHSHPLRTFGAPTEAIDTKADARLAGVAYALFVAFLKVGVE